MMDYLLVGGGGGGSSVAPQRMENLSDRNCRENCSRNADDSPEDILLFAGYSTALLQFAAMCCLLFMIVGILGNLITIVALLGCKKVRIYRCFTRVFFHFLIRFADLSKASINRVIFTILKKLIACLSVFR